MISEFLRLWLEMMEETARIHHEIDLLKVGFADPLVDGEAAPSAPPASDYLCAYA